MRDGYNVSYEVLSMLFFCTLKGSERPVQNDCRESRHEVGIERHCDVRTAALESVLPKHVVGKES